MKISANVSGIDGHPTAKVEGVVNISLHQSAGKHDPP